MKGEMNMFDVVVFGTMLIGGLFAFYQLAEHLYQERKMNSGRVIAESLMQYQALEELLQQVEPFPKKQRNKSNQRTTQRAYQRNTQRRVQPIPRSPQDDVDVLLAQQQQARRDPVDEAKDIYGHDEIHDFLMEANNDFLQQSFRP